MRLLVCGGRHWSWRAPVRAALERLRPELVIEGGASGADRLAREEAIALGIPVRTFRADWAKHGRAAGPLRNRQMLAEGQPDRVLALPGGAGTRDMKRQAEAAGVAVEVYVPTIHLDYETRSRAELKKVGAWDYSKHESTEPLCLAWALDDGPVHLWHPGLPNPTELFELIAQGALLEAWNVYFERAVTMNIMVKRYGWPAVRDEQWRCAMAKARAYALPGDLDGAAMALGTLEKKDRTGKALMLKLSRPRKPTKSNPSIWSGTPEEFQKLFEYCKQDVRTERAVSAQLKDLSDHELAVWRLCQQINMRGIAVDRELCEKAIALDAEAKADLFRQLAEVTGGAVEKASDRKGLLSWLKNKGVVVPTKHNAKDEVIETAETKSLRMLFDTHDLSPEVRRALELYIAANKTSVAKYKAMLAAGQSGRLREMFVYHAATTGRWAGRRVQLHNMPRPPEDLSNMEQLADQILDGDYDWLSWFYGRDRVLTVLSSGLRAGLTASPGRRLIAADFSAVETRGVAWVAGDEELLEVFRKLDADPEANWDVYTFQASQILGYEVTKKDKQLRQDFGKIPVLGGVYQMSAKKLVAYAEAMGVKLDPKVARQIVKGFRASRQPIVRFWSDIEEAAHMAVKRWRYACEVRAACIAARTPVPEGLFANLTVEQGRLRWRVNGRFLQVRLPSGRRLSYLDPRLEFKEISWDVEDEEGNYVETKTAWKETLTFMGSNTYTGKWERCSTYGGKLTENVVQAICRDLLADAMLRQTAAGYELVLHVHDESVADCPEGFGSLHEFESLMGVVPAWAEGLPLRAEGWQGRRFRK